MILARRTCQGKAVSRRKGPLAAVNLLAFFLVDAFNLWGIAKGAPCNSFLRSGCSVPQRKMRGLPTPQTAGVPGGNPCRSVVFRQESGHRIIFVSNHPSGAAGRAKGGKHMALLDKLESSKCVETVWGKLIPEKEAYQYAVRQIAAFCANLFQVMRILEPDLKADQRDL